MDSTTPGLVRSHAAGTTTITATYTGTVYYAERPPACGSYQYQASASSSVTVGESNCPDHLEVSSDNYIYVKCSIGLIPEREITYDILDANDKYVTNVPVDEAFSTLSSNTCNNGYPSPSGCTNLPSGTFTDHLWVGCNSVGGSCGFTIGIQQWHWCPTGYASVAIGTLDNDGLYSNKTTILGYTLPGGSQIPAGTMVYP